MAESISIEQMAFKGLNNQIDLNCNLNYNPNFKFINQQSNQNNRFNISQDIKYKSNRYQSIDTNSKVNNYQ